MTDKDFRCNKLKKLDQQSYRCMSSEYGFMEDLIK